MCLLLGVSLLLVVMRPLMSISNAAFTSVFQGGIRFNTYIGLALAASLYGSQGLVVAVIIAAIMIPVINIFCVAVLEYFGQQGGSLSLYRLCLAIITNPLIVACVIGMGINVLGLSLPQVLTDTLTIFSSAALPLGLLTVGAALSFDNLTASVKPFLLSSICKFLLLPLVALFFSGVFDLAADTQTILIMMCVLPTATASYVLAKQLGGDAQLMASLITAQTLVAIIVIPVILALVGRYGHL